MRAARTEGTTPRLRGTKNPFKFSRCLGASVCESLCASGPRRVPPRPVRVGGENPSLTPIARIPRKTSRLMWRRGWDSNPRAPYGTRRFRGAPVTTTSVPLRSCAADAAALVDGRCTVSDRGVRRTNHYSGSPTASWKRLRRLRAVTRSRTR